MKHAVAAAVLLVALWSGTARAAGAAEQANPTSVDSFLDQPIVEIRVEGPSWTADLKRNMPLRKGMWLTRDKLRRALLHFQQNRSEALAEVRVLAELATVDKRRGVRLIFRIEPVLRIQKVTFERSGPLDNGLLLRAANLPGGTEMWPDLLDQAASRVANEFLRAGWRDAEVDWDATAVPEGVNVRFTVRRGKPTTLVRLELTGDRALPDSELLGAFGLAPGQRLTMETLEEGVLQLKERYRALAFYQASVGQPVVRAADGRAVVEIRINAGPRFLIQFRGNRVFDDATLLSWLHYSGEEVLDAATEQDLAKRIRRLYELGGYPNAEVEPRESAAPPRVPAAPPSPYVVPRSPTESVLTSDGSPPATEVLPIERFLTFRIREGAEVRVVERRFEADLFLPTHPESDLQRRLDLELEDAVPKDLVNSLDDALLQAARLGGSPGAAVTARPRVQPHEVFSRAAYANACEQIKALYRAAGYLNVEVGPARRPVTLEGNKGRVVIPIVAGERFVVAGVYVDGVKELPEEQVLRVVTVHVGDVLNYQAIEDTRTEILRLYQSEGYLAANVDNIESAKPTDPTQIIVSFKVQEGVPVRVSSIDIKGANHTAPFLIHGALTLHKGDLIKPEERQKSVKNLLAMRIFNSVAITPKSTRSPETTLIVEVQERPSYSLDVTGGLSLVDGPRLGAQFVAGHFLGTTMTFDASAKLNVPIFRICSFKVRSCTAAEEAAQTAPTDPVERRLSVGLALPLFGQREEPPNDQRLDVVAQNMLRPAYYLQKYSVIATMNGLPHGRAAGLDLNTLFQLEVEADNFVPQRSAAAVATLADQKALLLPKGQTQVVSFRPTLTLDGRGPVVDGRRSLNPSSGGQATLTLDFAHDINIPALQKAGTTATPVSLISALITGGGYIPINAQRRVILALFGRAGGILSQYEQVIGTKVFFLGGTNSLRGFPEDGLIPQDVREAYAAGLRRCGQLLSGIGCTTGSQSTLKSSSQGGTVVLAGRGDLRFGLTESIDGDLFLDAGNLWSNPASFDLSRMRYSAGFGVAYKLPIGPASVDLAFNLDPDSNVGEALAQLHFAIGL